LVIGICRFEFLFPVNGTICLTPGFGGRQSNKIILCREVIPGYKTAKPLTSVNIAISVQETVLNSRINIPLAIITV
jgi:hypothetical protein